MLAPQNIKRTGISMTMYIVNWQNVILRHHANVHGGSSDLLAKPLDYIFLGITLVICTTQWLRVENSTHCGGEETGSKCLTSVYPKI